MSARRASLVAAACATIAGFLGPQATLGRAEDETPMVKDVDGRPEVKKADIHGYLLWHKDKGWRLVAGSTGRHHFKGRIYLTKSAHFKNVEQWKDASELYSEMENEDTFFKSLKFKPDKEAPNEISFDIVSQANHTSGIDFEVAPNEGKTEHQLGSIFYELGLGGPADKDPVTYDQKFVRIGKDGIHPPSIPFKTLSRHLAEQGR
jgi:hypothetical protein